MVKKTKTPSIKKKLLTNETETSAEPLSTGRCVEGIDIVVPMVFPWQPTWIEAYKEACMKAGVKAEINERYRSWDLERYFFRGIAKFMPFVRKIHLILSDEDQVPSWLDRDKVHIVLHKDIMPEEVLPTFNSSTIEMWLHNITGLSETFIYCNDDMIATSPMRAEDFFLDGMPVFHCESQEQPIVGSFLRTCKNSLDVASQDHDAVFADDELLDDGHSYAPLLLSVVKETVAGHGDVMRESCTPFRDEKNLCRRLYTYEQWLGKKYADGSHTHRYFTISSPYSEVEEELLAGEAGIACFNDTGIGDWREMKSMLYGVLQQILGEKCEYEL